MCSEVRGAEVRCRKGEDLEGEYFGFHHQEAGQGEPDHGTPILQSATSEAVPALSAGDEVDVEEEGDGEEGVGYGDGDRGAHEAPFELLRLVRKRDWIE